MLQTAFRGESPGYREDNATPRRCVAERRAVLHHTVLAESTTPDRDRLTLTREGREFVVRVRGEALMSTRRSGSEQAMATLALPAGAPSSDAQVLIGGLGIGYTLRAVLDHVGPMARVTVLELLGEVVDWNRGPLAACAGYALDDPRVEVRIGDLFDYLFDYLAAGTASFDAILLDVDNGPEAFTVRSNERLYQPAGLVALHRALRPGGVLVVWSAFRSQVFERRLQRAGFNARSVPVRARAGRQGRAPYLVRRNAPRPEFA